jgi:hypothetical protein
MKNPKDRAALLVQDTLHRDVYPSQLSALVSDFRDTESSMLRELVVQHPSSIGSLPDLRLVHDFVAAHTAD